jgi:hypothetical protein
MEAATIAGWPLPRPAYRPSLRRQATPHVYAELVMQDDLKTTIANTVAAFAQPAGASSTTLPKWSETEDHVLKAIADNLNSGRISGGKLSDQ